MTTAFRNSEGMMKVECSNKECNIVMVRTDKGRRHSVIEVYAAKLQEHCKKNSMRYHDGKGEMKQAL